jgi:hypothetical protein
MAGVVAAAVAPMVTAIAIEHEFSQVVEIGS